MVDKDRKNWNLFVSYVLFTIWEIIHAFPRFTSFKIPFKQWPKGLLDMSWEYVQELQKWINQVASHWGPDPKPKIVFSTTTGHWNWALLRRGALQWSERLWQWSEPSRSSDYLAGQQFTLVIYHAPLQWMAKAKDTNGFFFCKTSSNTELEPTIATLTGCQGGMPCGEYVELKGG